VSKSLSLFDFLLLNVVKDEVIDDKLYLTFKDIKYHLYKDYYSPSRFRENIKIIYNNKNLKLLVKKPINDNELLCVELCMEL
jgi:hypothetical protein